MENRDVIINDGMKYWLKSADGTVEKINSKQAYAIFRGWQDSGLRIRRKYGMHGRVTWVWAE